MALPIGRCPVYDFKPRVSFGNDLRMPASLYGIRVPQGLSEGSVPAPDPVSPERMVSMLRTDGGRRSNGLGVTHGLTRAEFSLAFSNPTRQWKQVGAAGAAPAWEFQGGDVYFDVTITVSVLQGDMPRDGDAISERIFAIIMSHELLHVADEIDIVTDWLPRRAVQDEMVVRYLSNAQPVDDSMFRNWFRGRGLRDWLYNGLWAEEHNRRGAARDAPSQYAILQQQIDELRIRATNQPSR